MQYDRQADLAFAEFLDRLVALLPQEYPHEVMEISNPRYFIDNYQ
jgi:hypothetical protein